MTPRLSHPFALLRHAVLPGALSLAACSSSWSEAHEWLSPEPPPVHSRAAPLPQQAAGAAWPGRVWAGPAAGAPGAPDASDCQRAPRTFDLVAMDAPPSSALSHRRAELSADTSAVRGSARARHGSADEAVALDAPGGTAADAAVSSKSAPAPQAAPPRERRPEQAVAAGVIDDNADFGAYLAYRERRAGLPVRVRDVEERYRLTVHDAAGRPVNDAEVSLHADGRALPLWARTDAGGQVWIHPGVMGAALGPQPLADGPAASAPHVIEVQAHRGGATGRALLTRGQRDDLQVRLHTRLPAERARLDLVFLVDATGSMADEIDKLQRSMRSMADQIARLPSRPDLCVALVAYRDRGDAFFVRATDFSADVGAFQRTLGALQADGGGDYPEALNEALHTAVHRLSWRGEGATRLVVLVADAPPQLGRGTPTYDDDMQGALARGIKLFAVGASGLDATGEYVFRQAAQYTGGRFVFLTYADARDPSRGPGRETTHDVGRYSVESLDTLVVRLVREELAKRPVG